MSFGARLCSVRSCSCNIDYLSASVAYVLFPCRAPACMYICSQCSVRYRCHIRPRNNSLSTCLSLSLFLSGLVSVTKITCVALVAGLRAEASGCHSRASAPSIVACPVLDHIDCASILHFPGDTKTRVQILVLLDVPKTRERRARACFTCPLQHNGTQHLADCISLSFDGTHKVYASIGPQSATGNHDIRPLYIMSVVVLAHHTRWRHT